MLYHRKNKFWRNVWEYIFIFFSIVLAVVSWPLIGVGYFIRTLFTGRLSDEKKVEILKGMMATAIIIVILLMLMHYTR